METHATAPIADEIERPVGRANVIEAALQAAAELFADNNYNQVSVREIARRAGVSHALVHRYLGYKADIFKAVLDWERDRAEKFWTNVQDTDDLREAYEANPADRYLRTVLRAQIEGVPFDLSERDFLGPRALLGMLKAKPRVGIDVEPGYDARILVMAAMAASAAYSLAPEFFTTAVGLEDMEPAYVRSEFDRFFTQTLELRA